MATNIIPFPKPPANEDGPLKLRPDVPAFDPTNPTHLRAWETMYIIGKKYYLRKGW